MMKFPAFPRPAWSIGVALLAAAWSAAAQQAPATPAATPAAASSHGAADNAGSKGGDSDGKGNSGGKGGDNSSDKGNSGGKGKSGNAATPEEEPSTQVLSDTLHYDDVKKQSIFTGNVVMTRGLMTLHSDQLELHEDAQGNQYGTATANPGKMVNIRQERPETYELIDGTGLRAEYDGSNSQFDLIGQAVVIRYICGKQFDTIRGQRVRYNEKAGTYEAIGGPGSAAPGGRVRSVVEPRSRTDAAVEECRKEHGAQGTAGAPARNTSGKPARTPAKKETAKGR